LGHGAWGLDSAAGFSRFVDLLSAAVLVFPERFDPVFLAQFADADAAFDGFQEPP